jgi:hypothetical protein
MIASTAMAVLFATAGIAPAQTSLIVPQGTAFAAIGHSCGGIQEQSFATGFDPTSGYPTGDVYVQTRCGGSGRGGGYHTTTYSAWLGVTWDYTGTVVSSAVLAAAPAVDPAFSAFDAHGNKVYNQASRAYLALAATFAPPPRVTAISVTSGPASGGTSVVVTGTGFTGATGVSFGDVPAASFTIDGDGSISALSPVETARTVDVTVTTPGGTSATVPEDEFTFVGTPSVTGLSPSSGPLGGGTLVTITGTNFVDVAEVDFGETPVGFTVNDDRSITAVSPPGEEIDTVGVRVVTIGGTSPSSAADQFTYTAAAGGSSCGDGVLDPDEACDDGAANGQPGDCCTAVCQFQTAGTSCADDGDSCTADTCDGAGACLHAVAPADACVPPDVAKGASLFLRTPPSGRSQLQFTWAKGPAVSRGDFGDPAASDTLRLCIYEGSAGDGWALAFSGAPSAADGTWTMTSSGWKFRGADGVPDGITHVLLKGSAVPLRAELQVIATQRPVIGPLPLVQDPSVVVQLRSSLGTCWGAAFSAPSVNTATEYRAKSD